MSEKHIDNVILAGVAVVIETEFDKVAVVSNHVRNWICQLGDDASERRLNEGILQVLHNSEIDSTFFKESDRPRAWPQPGLKYKVMCSLAMYAN